MADYKGIDYLKQKLAAKQARVLVRYKYYDMKNCRYDPGNIIPDKLKSQYNAVLGWCAKAVDSLADRLVFEGFEEDNFDMNNIFSMNNPDILFSSAINGALISSCDFIYISADETGYPKLQVINGANATGIIDPITNMLTEGYAVLQRDDSGNPIIEAYMNIDKTDFIYSKNRGVYVETINNPAPYALLVPIIYRPDATRYFGHSRISRTCMDLMDKARFTLTRGEVTAEFYSFPQKYILGMSSEADPLDAWRATISSMLRIDKDEDGDKPTLGQFQSASMAPHIEQLRMYASLFAGETGLTLDDLGFASGNPSSAEAIKAAHENLRLAARKAQRDFGSGFLNAGYLAACVRDDFAYQRKQIYLTKPSWAPVFEPDAAMLSSMGDGAIKINQTIPGYFAKDNLKKLTGIEPSKEYVAPIQ